MAAVITYTTAHTACLFESSSIEVTWVRVTVTVTSWERHRTPEHLQTNTCFLNYLKTNHTEDSCDEKRLLFTCTVDEIKLNCVYIFVNIKIKSCFYSCRCRLCLLLLASRGSHGESPDISHSSLQLCCANRHIDHEPEEQKKKQYLQKLPDKSCVDLFIHSQSLSSCLNCYYYKATLILD